MPLDIMTYRVKDHKKGFPSITCYMYTKALEYCNAHLSSCSSNGKNTISLVHIDLPIFRRHRLRWQPTALWRIFWFLDARQKKIQVQIQCLDNFAMSNALETLLRRSYARRLPSQQVINYSVTFITINSTVAHLFFTVGSIYSWIPTKFNYRSSHRSLR